MKQLLADLEKLTGALEDYAPKTNVAALVRRELLELFDKAHEMLKCLADDHV